jgi:poly [ADP-ribose] polymerase
MIRGAAQSESQAILLKGYRIVLTGKFPGHPHAELENLINALGGIVLPKVNKKTTIVIAAHLDWRKVKDAVSMNIDVVQLGWLFACQDHDTKADRAPYLWNASSPMSQAPAKLLKRTNNADKQIYCETVPVDKECLWSDYYVYVDDNQTIWDATLQVTCTGTNTDKFYAIQVSPVSHYRFL